jgi:uncharacterized protein
MLRGFEWDENKNRSNLAKHKVSFKTAVSAFEDPHALSVQDRFVNGEERWQTLGMVDGIILMVAHTSMANDNDETIRIVSARKATPTERRTYAESQQRPR